MYLTILSSPSEPGDLAFSALPDAPVVPGPTPRRGGTWVLGTRAALAAGLHRFASAVEPTRHPRALRG